MREVRKMIVLEERITIRARPEQYMDFVDHLDQNYSIMSPDHVRFTCVTGRPTEPGAVCEQEEYFQGRRVRNRYRITEVVPNRRIVGKVLFPRSLFGAKLINEIHPRGAEIEVVETICLGHDIPILGRIWDLLLGLVFKPLVPALRAHQIEGLTNIKRHLEAQR
jgi:hypothetical protein